MQFRLAIVALLAACPLTSAQAITPPSQQATVTFYAPGGAWKRLATQTVTAGEGYAPSVGSIFDGSQHLGAISPGKFAAFYLPPGKHTFLASYGLKGRQEAVELDIQPGGRYFLFVTTTRVGAAIFQSYTSHLQAVDCAAAQAAATVDKAKRIEAKWIDKSLLGSRLVSDTFPICPD